MPNYRCDNKSFLTLLQQSGVFYYNIIFLLYFLLVEPIKFLFNEHTEGDFEVKKTPLCNSCSSIVRLNRTINRTIVNLQNGRKYRTVVKTNCQSSNLVYAISCNLCQIQYVGKTKNTIVQRFGTHFYDIEHKLDTTVARHLPVTMSVLY